MTKAADSKPYQPALSPEQRRRDDLLMAGLDLLDQAIAVFDATPKLVTWNKALLRLLDFPESLVKVGTPFEAFVRFNAERGEYGEGDIEKLIAALIGLVFMPWKLLATSGGYLFTWLGGYGTLLGAIAGILLVDYYLVRKSELKVDDLYRRGGEYEYSNGWNVQALIAFALGVLPCLPGYLAVSGVIDKAAVPGLLLALFDFGWFFSLAVAGTYYYLTAKKK